jgi:hypothetical protein
METTMDKINVFLEIGKTRTLASAVDWPGWCRGGRDEAAALQALFDYGPRYARAIRSARQGFEPPTQLAALAVVERLPGGPATDFGVPERGSAADAAPVALDDLRRLIALLRACWKALDSAAENAAGHALRKGPRGGGRELDKIIEHALGAEGSYVGSLGGKLEAHPELDADQALRETRKAILRNLEHAAEGKFPAVGPRGGKRWTARYFVRRDAWHILDHAWEIEDRVLP